MIKNTPAEDEALRRIEAAIYELTLTQREDLTASAVRNIVTDLWPAIRGEIRRAAEEQREADAQIAYAAVNTSERVTRFVGDKIRGIAPSDRVYIKAGPNGDAVRCEQDDPDCSGFVLHIP